MKRSWSWGPIFPSFTHLDNRHALQNLKSLVIKKKKKKKKVSFILEHIHKNEEFCLIKAGNFGNLPLFPFSPSKKYQMEGRLIVPYWLPLKAQRCPHKHKALSVVLGLLSQSYRTTVTSILWDDLKSMLLEQDEMWNDLQRRILTFLLFCQILHWAFFFFFLTPSPHNLRA